jgi:hypothetical protein
MGWVAAEASAMLGAQRFPARSGAVRAGIPDAQPRGTRAAYRDRARLGRRGDSMRERDPLRAPASVRPHRREPPPEQLHSIGARLFDAFLLRCSEPGWSVKPRMKRAIGSSQQTLPPSPVFCNLSTTCGYNSVTKWARRTCMCFSISFRVTFSDTKLANSVSGSDSAVS